MSLSLYLQALCSLRLSLCFFKSLLFLRLLSPTSNPGELWQPLACFRVCVKFICAVEGSPFAFFLPSLISERLKLEKRVKQDSQSQSRTSIEVSLRARHYCECFACESSLNSHSNPIYGTFIVYSHRTDEKKLSPETLGNLLKSRMFWSYDSGPGNVVSESALLTMRL